MVNDSRRANDVLAREILCTSCQWAVRAREVGKHAAIVLHVHRVDNLTDLPRRQCEDCTAHSHRLLKHECSIRYRRCQLSVPVGIYPLSTESIEAKTARVLRLADSIGLSRLVHGDIRCVTILFKIAAGRAIAIH